MVEPLALVVDDEPQMRAIVTFALETQGFRCVEAGSAEEGWRIVETSPLDLVVLDVMLPNQSGIELCRQIRRSYAVPIILLTARGEVDDRVEGLEAGADDYLVKPFSPRELALRAQGVVRRSAQPARPMVIEVGDIEIDLTLMRATERGVPLQLSVVELRLLVALATRLGESVPWRELIREVWAVESDEGGREMLKTAVYRLRSRLEVDPSRPAIILTARGVGYRMVRGPR